MSKIIDEAKPVAEGKKWVVYMDVRRTARRVLLLEKAYRYQRAAMMLRYWQFKHKAERLKSLEYMSVVESAFFVECKAAELYRQAEKL